MGPILRIVLLTLLGLGLVVALTVGALVVGGPSLARGLVENYVRDLTGRDFVIEGDFQPQWGRHLDVTGENLRLANADWAADEPMLTIRRLRVALDPWTLVDGPLLLEAIEIDEARLYLEEHRKHGANWDMFPPGDADAPGLEFVIRKIRVHDSTIRYEAPNFDRSLVIDIDDLNQDLNEQDFLDTRLQGDINDLPLKVVGELGPFDSLVTGAGIRFSLDGRLRAATLTATGEIDDLINPQQPRLELILQAPEGGNLTELLGVGRLGDGPVELTANLAPKAGTNQLRINGRQGELRIDIAGSIRDIQNFDGISLDADIAGPYLGRVLRLFDLEGPDDPFSLRTDLVRDGKLLRVDEANFKVADAIFDLSGELTAFPTLDDAQVNLAIIGSDIEKLRQLLQVPGIATGPFEITAKLEVTPSGVEQLTVQGRTNLGRLSVDGTLGDPETLVGTSVRYKAEGDSLKKLGDAGGIPNLPAEFFRMTGLLEFEVEDQVEWREFVLTLGDDRLVVDGSAGLDETLAGTDLQVSMAGSDLAQIVAMFGVTQGIPAEPYDIKGRLRVDAKALRLDDVVGRIEKVDFDGSATIARTEPPAGSKLRVHIRGPNLRATVVAPEIRDYVPPAPFDVRGRMEFMKDGLRYDVESATIAEGSFKGGGFLSNAPNLVGTEVRISGSGPDLARVAPVLPRFTPPRGPFEVNGRIERLSTGFGLDNVRVTFGGAKARIDAELDLPFGSSGGRFDLDLRGPDASVLPSIEGFVPDPLPFLMETRGDWQQSNWRIEKFVVQLGDAEVRTNGTISGVPDAPAADLEVNASIPSLAQLGTLQGRRPNDQPLELFAKFHDDTGAIDIRTLTARLGQSDLSGRVRLQPGDVPELDIDLYSNRFYPPRLFPAEHVADAAQPETPAQPRDRLIPDTPLPLEDLREFNLHFNFEAAELQVRRALWKNLAIDANVQDGALRIHNAEVEGVAGTLTGNFALVPVDDSADLALEFQITDLTTGVLTDDAEEPALLPKISAQSRLTSHGKDLHEVATNLTGDGWFTSTNGRVANNSLAGLFTGDFVTEFLNAVNPFARTQPYTEVVCIAMPFVVRQGDIASNPTFAIQTGRLNIFSRGDINLANERLDLGFRTQARQGLGISASQLINPFVRIGGTLRNPRLEIDAQGSLVEGGATVATGGLWLFARGAMNSIFRAKDPCGKSMEQHEQRLAKAAEQQRQ
ncbi:MAG: AsmA family protein [Gammaproteobacteria bacterium]|nr:AsmA family protein [Gammaproteobacteria bacterium]